MNSDIFDQATEIMYQTTMRARMQVSHWPTYWASLSQEQKESYNQFIHELLDFNLKELGITYKEWKQQSDDFFEKQLGLPSKS